MKDRIYYAIEYFVETPIEIVSREEEEILFVTEEGEQGKIQKNWKGDWSVYLEDRVIYEIESSFFENTFSEELTDASEYYQSLKALESFHYQTKTKVFLESLIASTEYLLLFAPAVVPEKSVVIGPFWVNNLLGFKNITCLN